ncbi:tetraspanin 42En isoform X2 [Haematobia irritans]|uniref:tetraspanin 42En isoform X2 n=1 Tax=Haematobia irritans TaxID=7368 RepID=UPI003F4F77B7
MSCQLSFYKVLLSIVNTVLSLLGIGLIALSVYELNSSTPGTFEHVAVVVQIFIGSFVILTSFTGCIGACRHSLSLVWSYRCCGRNGSRDYQPIIGSIPKKCYLNQERTSQNLFKDGCLDIVVENASKNSHIGLTVKWIIFFLELCALGLASLLGINLRNKRRRGQFVN